VTDAEEHLAARLTDRAFLEPFEPERDEAYYTLAGQRQMLAKAAADRSAGASYSFAIVERTSGAIVGTITLSMVVRAAWQNAMLGYWIAQAAGGHGYATAAVGRAVGFAFDDHGLGLHRVQAGVMPQNGRSIRVLEKNGFRREGLAERYLRIAGRWEDHLLFALTAEEHRRSIRSPATS
jgi:ribosomal-protein-alanine N-acetyltransferase